MNLLDVLRHDQAGDAILLQAVRGMGAEEKVSFIRNNVDHYSGATFGCHENYLVRRAAPLTETNLRSLLAFLTLRLLYTGAGRVGATVAAEGRGEWPRPGPGALFQISQRADYIKNDLFEWVQFNRAIINTRDEPLADARKYRRLHLLHGDTNVLPASLLLKVGTTSLALDLLEMNCLPKIMLDDPVAAFRQLSHQPGGPWLVQLSDGRCVDAVLLLQQFHRAARQELGGRDAETDALLSLWGETLAALATEPESLVGRVDWITKRWLLQQFCDREKIPGAIPGSSHRTWNITTLIRRAAWGWRWPGRRRRGKFRRRTPRAPPCRPRPTPAPAPARASCACSKRNRAPTTLTGKSSASRAATPCTCSTPSTPTPRTRKNGCNS